VISSRPPEMLPRGMRAWIDERWYAVYHPLYLIPWPASAAANVAREPECYLRLFAFSYHVYAYATPIKCEMEGFSSRPTNVYITSHFMVRSAHD